MGQKSKKLFEKAKRLIPGGVNSPVRAGKAVGIDPPFISRAKGCFLWDADQKRYVDYVCSWGPMILGHAHPAVVKVLQERLPKGASYGAPTQLEVEMAEMITEMVPSVEMVRMVNSGTEATMSAIRLARGYTGRDKIIKFEGCYHGHADSLLVSAGSGVATFGIPGCPGVPAELAEHTLSLPFNDQAQVEKAMDHFGEEVASIIVEPIPGNMGVVLPKEGFLERLREITLKHGSLLVFDEVISGFRVAPGGAQELYGIKPDLTCLGKIIGGGLPVGAYGGRKEIMASVAPEGSVYQAGTLSGNPLAMAAGLATLKELRKRGVYQELEEKGRRLFTGLEDAAKSVGLDVRVNRVGSMGTLFFSREAITDFASAKRSDAVMFGRFYASMLKQGIYLAPSAFESWFISTAHDEPSIDKTVACAERAFGLLKKRKIR
ncbi:MAG: glutamate-1-semialdehyde 2,1-aminomutase [Deltaproteobacteria bacterium]|nr:glutamate-1-semialdehyde 2,1-aminomutase [Deltaproteobacteria bacterium]